MVEPAFDLFKDLSPCDALHDVSHIIRDWFMNGETPDRVVVEEVFGWLYKFTVHLRYPEDSTSAGGTGVLERRSSFKPEVLIKCPCE